MKLPHMQHFMSNRTFREVSVGRCKELDALSVDDDCKFALTSSSAFVLLEIKECFDLYARTYLHFTNELLDRFTKAGKIFGLHKSKMLEI
jgi:hypothetical protein